LIPFNPLPAPRRRKITDGRKHLPAVLNKEGVGAILRAADKAEPGKGVHRAHLIAVFTAQRIGEIVGASWDEVDLRSAVWSIPRDRMKRKDVARGPHLVPIPPRLLAMMAEWKRSDGKGATYVCPSPQSAGAVTREAVEKFYRRSLELTGKHSPHSWRSVLSTWGNDAGRNSDAIEAQLDHVVGDKTKTSYDHAKRLALRVDLMAWHEDALYAARDGAHVFPMRQPSSKT
jgi:integrase